MIATDDDLRGLRVIGLGDNVVDRYLNAGVMYPGGNALNFAAYAKMLGADAAFLGTFGTDRAGHHVRATLDVLAIPTTHCRVVEGANGHADVRIVDGNREFVSSNKGGVAREHPFVPAQADLDYLARFALVHTSCYSHLNSQLTVLRPACALLSYDFSYRWQVDDLIGPVAPHLDFAALSAGDVGRERAMVALRETVAQGCGLALATLGPEGAIAYNGEDFITVAPKPTEVVDTLGAGDAFITATLLSLVAAGWRRGVRPPAGVIRAALDRGAEFAAQICRVEGAFGHAAPIDAETPA
ncbi:MULTISPECIES: fructoselysine 6-kinase [unclassified Chelatococcus]|uniref:fructoselysine 6-kinase n=1 Tax=unclassified Chelatococcus TaxID=2638111 RepID=UPI001BD14E4B|nr:MULTISPECIES: fructoselysine 6-kinase [unclassified Chelatococcus]CAH1650928.1 Sugar/nucleoside kinase (Ribokinase family) [Hyphomicrobiales bacterium]MBS7743241.1 fructoselysine 6-kinase [Chelatococcus sp. HY11]MBX3541641.1 fructoselysine 6-kinase [Chelatococcus sp.]MCO5074467.1 fructoselysine 6-kinase [Chelatococcus sp.]CAH1692936.1 Sugar/nucleoside kinase (Ribokinase family) [Hyphomicrobiales bacterium]